MRDSVFFWDEDEPKVRRPAIIGYSFVLRPDFIAYLRLPDDLNLAEVERIAKMLRTLPIPGMIIQVEEN